jgi:hypothetical protein
MLLLVFRFCSAMPSSSSTRREFIDVSIRQVLGLSGPLSDPTISKRPPRASELSDPDLGQGEYLTVTVSSGGQDIALDILDSDGELQLLAIRPPADGEWSYPRVTAADLGFAHDFLAKDIGSFEKPALLSCVYYRTKPVSDGTLCEAAIKIRLYGDVSIHRVVFVKLPSGEARFISARSVLTE